MIILHFLRDAALERRLSRLLTAQTEAALAAAEADLKQAVALAQLGHRVEELEKTIYRIMTMTTGEEDI